MPEIIIGVMSGSSLDGLDMAACQIQEDGTQIHWTILDSVTLPYSEHWYTALKAAPRLSGYELMKLDADFGKFIGYALKSWMSGKSWTADYVASHGHTVFHEPALGFSTQIGNGAHIAAESGLDTITNFRNADVANGGQGAPFAPVADRALFPGYDAYLNLGGIANIYLATNDGRWLAWDIGPCNQALNYLANKAGHKYDQGGMLASQGAVLDAIRHDLIAMFPFEGGGPRSISNATVQSTWIEYLSLRKEDPVDLLSTTTLAIADLITMHVSPIMKRPSRILTTGGGAHNSHLMELLQRPGLDFGFTFDTSDAHIIDHKESLLMAYLGYLSAHDKAFDIHGITGAVQNSIGGVLHKAVR